MLSKMAHKSRPLYGAEPAYSYYLAQMDLMVNITSEVERYDGSLEASAQPHPPRQTCVIE